MTRQRGNLLTSLLIIGIVLDIIIGGVFIVLNTKVSGNVHQISRVTVIGQCWDNLLRDLVLHKVSHTHALVLARECAEMRYK